MIFVTVGTQLPFDRLVGVVDVWAGDCGRAVFAQVGPTRHPPRHLQWASFLSPSEHQARFSAASVVIAHAGMGTILEALSQSKPLLIMPRRADFGEQRNDHQLATARRFADRPGIHIAMDEAGLQSRLQQIDDLIAGPPISPSADAELVAAVRTFIVEGVLPRRRAPISPSMIVRSRSDGPSSHDG